jgi:plasmid stabilization system protein ParE
MDLIWTNIAKEDYWSNIDYLLDEFGENKAKEFISDVERYLILVENDPYTFPFSEYRNLRYLVIVPKITLFYRIIDNSRVELIRFWNNSKNPNSF